MGVVDTNAFVQLVVRDDLIGARSGGAVLAEPGYRILTTGTWHNSMKRFVENWFARIPCGHNDSDLNRVMTPCDLPGYSVPSRLNTR